MGGTKNNWGGGIFPPCPPWRRHWLPQNDLYKKRYFEHNLGRGARCPCSPGSYAPDGKTMKLFFSF